MITGVRKWLQFGLIFIINHWFDLPNPRLSVCIIG